MVAVSWWLIWDAGLTVAVPLIIIMIVVVAYLILR
jgi:hypothetical protein